MTSFLFDKGRSAQPSPAEVAGSGRPRLRVPHREQIEMHWASLDELLEVEHRARVVWAARISPLPQKLPKRITNVSHSKFGVIVVGTLRGCDFLS